MQSLVVRPFRGMLARQLRMLLFAFVIVPMMGMALLVLVVHSALGLTILGRMLGMFVPIDLGLAALFALVFWSSARVQWTFSAAGIQPNRSPLVPWQFVTGVRYAPRAATGNSGSSASVIIDCCERPSLSLQMALIDADELRGVLAILMNCVPAEMIDPNVLVVQDMLETTAMLRSMQGALPARVSSLLGEGRFRSAIPKLERARKQEAAARQADSYTPMLLAEAYLLGRRYPKAQLLAAELEQSKPDWPWSRVIRSMACAGLFQWQEAADLLAGVNLGGVRGRVVQAAAQGLSTVDPKVMSAARNRSRILGALAIAVLVLYCSARLLRAFAVGGAHWAGTVSGAVYALELIALGGFLAYEMSLRSRQAREQQEALAARPQRSMPPADIVAGLDYEAPEAPAFEYRPPTAPFAPAGAATPADVAFDAPATTPASPPAWAAPVVPVVAPAGSGKAARVFLYLSLTVIGLVIVALVGLRIAGTLVPGLLVGSGGEWLALGQFESVALIVLFICAPIVVWSVRFGALKTPTPRTGPLAENPMADPMRANPSAPMLNANIGTGYVVAALAVAGVFALAALGFAAWDVAAPHCVTTGAKGDIYTIWGDKIYHWDAQGTQTVAANLRTAPQYPQNTCDLRVGSDGTMYVSDVGNRCVEVFDRFGSYQRSLKSTLPYSSSGEWEWDIATAPTPAGSVTLDRGVVTERDSAGTVVASKTYPGLAWAQDVESGNDGATYVADTSHGRVLRIVGGSTSEVDCLGLPDGYRYPSVVRISPTGQIYVVMRKLWGDSGGPGRTLSSLGAPHVWMGRLYRVDFATNQATAVPVNYHGQPVSIDYVGFQPDGTPIISALNEAWIYRVPSDSNADAERLTYGDLQRTLGFSDRLGRLVALAPQVLWALAVIVPILIGVAGVRAGRKPAAWKDGIPTPSMQMSGRG